MPADEMHKKKKIHPSFIFSPKWHQSNYCISICIYKKKVKTLALKLGFDCLSPSLSLSLAA